MCGLDSRIYGRSGYVHDSINPLNAELNPICHLLALLEAHHILHVSRIRVTTPKCYDVTVSLTFGEKISMNHYCVSCVLISVVQMILRTPFNKFLSTAAVARDLAHEEPVVCPESENPFLLCS